MLQVYSELPFCNPENIQIHETGETLILEIMIDLT